MLQNAKVQKPSVFFENNLFEILKCDKNARDNAIVAIKDAFRIKMFAMSSVLSSLSKNGLKLKCGSAHARGQEACC